MNEIQIQLSEGRTAWFPGERLIGTVTWALPTPPEEMELRLFWFTQGKGTQDIRIVEQQQIQASSAQGEEAFEFRLPLSPYSVNGTLLSITWALECVSRAGNATGRQEFNLTHVGHEIQLAPAPEDEPGPVGWIKGKLAGTQEHADGQNV